MRVYDEGRGETDALDKKECLLGKEHVGAGGRVVVAHAVEVGALGSAVSAVGTPLEGAGTCQRLGLAPALHTIQDESIPPSPLTL